MAAHASHVHQQFKDSARQILACIITVVIYYWLCCKLCAAIASKLHASVVVQCAILNNGKNVTYITV